MQIPNIFEYYIEFVFIVKKPKLEYSYSYNSFFILTKPGYFEIFFVDISIFEISRYFSIFFDISKKKFRYPKKKFYIDISKFQNFEKINFEIIFIRYSKISNFFIRYYDISKSLFDIYRTFRYFEIVIR